VGDDPQAGKYNFPKANRFDLVLTPHLPYIDLYKQYGANARWWTQACDIDYLNQVQDVPIVYQCGSTCGPRGNGLTERVKEALGDQFIYDRYYYNKDHTRRLKSFRMIFHHSQYQEIGRRIMEGTGCGKLVICDRLPENTGLSKLFTEGEEIVYFDSADDCIDKIKYYASNDEERERIALNGYNKVMANHTVKNRVDQLLQLCCEIRPELRERL
jgi:glycosyl transferase family 1